MDGKMVQVDEGVGATGAGPAREILLGLSKGRLTLMEATRRLGVGDAGRTLAMLRDEGLVPYRLPREVVQRQLAAARPALDDCLLDKSVLRPRKE